jgi:putative transcriptional regulator
MKPLANNLREIRARFRITQERLAKEISVSRQTIIAIESGEYNPSVTLALNIAAYFKLNLEEIFYLGDEKNELPQ